MAAPATRNVNERFGDALVRQSNVTSLRVIFQGFGTPDQMTQALAANVYNPPAPPGQG